MIHNLLAIGIPAPKPPPGAANPFGKVNPPPGVNAFPGKGQVSDVGVFLTIILRTMILGAGVYALFNIVFAGYSFLSAGGESKRIEAAWAKIWQGILGLGIAAGSFVIAALLGRIFFGSFTAIIDFQIFGI